MYLWMIKWFVNLVSINAESGLIGISFFEADDSDGNGFDIPSFPWKADSGFRLIWS
jgi:hypothetical protein